MKNCTIIHVLPNEKDTETPANNIFVLKMPSAFYVCCIYSLVIEANTMHPDQTAPESDLGPYRLQ